MAAIRGYAPRTSLRQRVRLLLLYMAKIGASGGYCLHTNILIKSQMPVYCSFTCIKKLYLLLSTNYNHLTTLYPPVNNVLKKWPGRLVTLQHLVLFRDTLIYFSYYRIKSRCMVGFEPTATFTTVT